MRPDHIICMHSQTTEKSLVTSNSSGYVFIYLFSVVIVLVNIVGHGGGGGSKKY